MEMNRWKWLSYSLMALLVVGASCKDDDDDDNGPGQGGNNPEKGRSEAIFQQITQSNLAEIQLGQLAYTKANDSLVMEFGQMMVDSHQVAQEFVDSVGEKRDLDLPDGLDQANQQLKDSLSTLSGVAFDSAYLRSQIRMHTMVLAMYTSILDTTTDLTLKKYVELYWPGVNKHLMLADSLLNNLDTIPRDPGNPPVDTLNPPVDTLNPPVDTLNPPVDTTQNPPVDTNQTPGDTNNTVAAFFKRR